MKTYILSGGKSSRMGTDKGLVLLHQKPLVSYLIETLQNVGQEIKIIAHEPGYLNFNLPVIQDYYPEKGPLGGIFTALRDAKSDCLIISVDTPFIRANQFMKMMEVHQENQLTLAFSNTKMYPLFGIYPHQIITQVEKSIQQNKLKLMDFLDGNSYQKVDFNFSMLEKMNINTFEELKKAEKILENGN